MVGLVQATRPKYLKTKPPAIWRGLMIKPNETPRIFFEKVKFEVRFD